MHDRIEQLNGALAGRYRVEREIGAGGMATVYLAEDERHHRKVALKVLHPDVASAVGAERFLREIEIAANLRHPHILPLYDSGEAAGLLYYVMPFVEGESLGRRLAREGELPVIETIRILRDVTDALSKAHGQGLVHRDIKPDNVLLEDRHAIVSDFGVARAVSSARESSTLTTAGVALGTPAYMAPEQAAADPNVDHRADIYAIGAMAYEMLTGAAPFTGASASQVLAAHMTRAPEPVEQRRPAVPPPLAALVMRCLEKKPADRWQSASELLAQLETMLTAGGSRAAPARQVENASQRGNRAPRRLVAAAGVVALVAAGWFGWSQRGTNAPLDENLVVVLPFRITGGDAETRVLREGMLDMMSTYLTGEAGTPRAAEPNTVMAAWRRRVATPDDDLADEDARALARSLGAGNVLTGSIVGTGSRIVLRGQLAPAAGGVSIQANVEGSSDSLFALMPRFVGQLLARSAGLPADASANLTTSSLPALRAYLQGQAAYRRAQYAEAVDRFSEALEIDTTFALAGLGLGLANGWIGTASPRATAIARQAAWRHRDRLSPRDRAVLLANAPRGPIPTDRATVLRARQEATVVAADRAEAWYYLGDAYFHDGLLLGIDDAFVRAEDGLRRALQRDSSVAGITQHLMFLAAAKGDTAELRRLNALHEKAASNAIPMRWFTAVVTGDTALRDAALSAVPGSDHETANMWGIAEFMTAHVAEARVWIERQTARATTTEERNPARLSKALLEWDAGRPLDAERALPDGLSSDVLRILAALFWSGDSTAAVRASSRLEQNLAGRENENPACAVGLWKIDRGSVAGANEAVRVLRATDATRDRSLPPTQAQLCASIIEAIEAQRAQRAIAPQLVDSLDAALLRVPYRELYWENLALARLLEGQGKYARAAAAARRRLVLFSESMFLATHFRESGRLAERAGDPARAIEAYTKYLELRQDPEPSLAADVAHVRDALRRLTGERAER